MNGSVALSDMALTTSLASELDCCVESVVDIFRFERGTKVANGNAEKADTGATEKSKETKERRRNERLSKLIVSLAVCEHGKDILKKGSSVHSLQISVLPKIYRDFVISAAKSYFRIPVPGTRYSAVL